MIVTGDLTKRYGQVTALDNLSVDVPEGVVGLVGANGAGKSTLIKILLGLLPATSGTARVLGLDVDVHGGQIREQVGYMPEHDCLPADASATEFVVHMGRMSGLPHTVARERAADTLRHVGLYEERYRPIGGYSTGMKQRVKLAQAIVHDPRLVLLDEPTNGLDPLGRDDMLGLIRRIGTDFGISVLVTSHLLGELERICDHVVVIDGGRLLRSTPTSDMVAASGVLTVEVDDRAAELADALAGVGLTVRHPADPLGSGSASNTVDVDSVDEATFDLVRDHVAVLGIGLVRLQQRRHRMVELFTERREEAHVR
jgi:ABC-2 type transport system ATP-binding protein